MFMTFLWKHAFNIILHIYVIYVCNIFIYVIHIYTLFIQVHPSLTKLGLILDLPFPRGQLSMRRRRLLRKKEDPLRRIGSGKASTRVVVVRFLRRA